MVLRNVPKTDTFEQQRQEINEIAADLHALNTTVTNFSLDDLVDVTAANPNVQQIIKYNGTAWVLDTDVVSTSFTVVTNPASGGGALSYNNGTAVFQYTPPDLSGFLTTLGSVSGHTDVTVNSPSVGQVLKWNGTAWENGTDTSANISTLNQVGNVTISNPQANEVLKWNGTAWVNGTDNTGTTISGINDIGDVSITSAQTDQLLKWNGSNWVNFTPGYLTSFTETDPTVPTHVKNITQADINSWNSKSTVSALNDLSDVNTSGLANNKILKYNGTSWVIADDDGAVQSDWAATSGLAAILNKPTIPVNLQDLSNVTITSPTNGQVLKYNGTSWVNDTDATASGGGGGATVSVSDTAPSSPSNGDLWYKSDEGRLKIYYTDGDSNQWVDAHPIGTGSSYGDSNVDTHLNTSSASASEVLSWNGNDYAWIAQSSGGGVSLTSFSVVSNSPGSAALSYNNTNGTFTYTPPDVSGFLTSIPVASSSVLGGIKIGTNLSIDGNGVVSSTDTVYSLPTASSTVLGGVKIGSGIDITAGVISTATPTQITVADESSDDSCYPLFVKDATGDLEPKTGTNLKFNSSSGQIEAGGFKKTGGSSSEFLKADGSVDSSSYHVFPVGGIILWSGASNAIPSGWILCDGQTRTINGSQVTPPDLRNTFVVGAGSTYNVGDTGGSANATLVSHSHTINNHTHSFSGSGSHDHSFSGSGSHDHSFSGSDSVNISVSGSGTTGNQSQNHTHTFSTNSTGSHIHGMDFGDGTDDQGGSGPKDTSDWVGNYNRNTKSAGSHSHSGTTAGISTDHNHNFSFSGSGSDNVNISGTTGSQSVSISGTTGSQSVSISGTTGNPSDTGTNTQGSSATGANLPPYYALCYIMKTT